MNRRTFLGYASSLAALGLFAQSGRPVEARDRTIGSSSFINPAKVLIVVADDMPETGFSREVMPKTWNWLVDSGVLFRKGYAVDPWCGPSRATLLTGLWVHNHGFLNGFKTSVATWYDEYRESDTIATRAKAIFGDAGRTAMIGKYLNGTDPTRVPPGWDLFVIVERYGSLAESYTVHENGQASEVSTDYNDTTLIFDRARRFVAQQANKPWLLYVAPNAPHGGQLPRPNTPTTSTACSSPKDRPTTRTTSRSPRKPCARRMRGCWRSAAILTTGWLAS